MESRSASVTRKQRARKARRRSWTPTWQNLAWLIGLFALLSNLGLLRLGLPSSLFRRTPADLVHETVPRTAATALMESPTWEWGVCSGTAPMFPASVCGRTYCLHSIAYPGTYIDLFYHSFKHVTDPDVLHMCEEPAGGQLGYRSQGVPQVRPRALICAALCFCALRASFLRCVRAHLCWQRPPRRSKKVCLVEPGSLGVGRDLGRRRRSLAAQRARAAAAQHRPPCAGTTRFAAASLAALRARSPCTHARTRSHTLASNTHPGTREHHPATHTLPHKHTNTPRYPSFCPPHTHARALTDTHNTTHNTRPGVLHHHL